MCRVDGSLHAMSRDVLDEGRVLRLDSCRRWKILPGAQPIGQAEPGDMKHLFSNPGILKPWSQHWTTTAEANLYLLPLVEATFVVCCA